MGTADANYSPGSLSFTRPSVITREALRITSVFNGIIASLPTLLHALHSFFAPSFLLLSIENRNICLGQLYYTRCIRFSRHPSFSFLSRIEIFAQAFANFITRAAFVFRAVLPSPFDRELKYLLRITWTGRESNVFLAKGEKPGTANPRREGRMRTTAAAT